MGSNLGKLDPRWPSFRSGDRELLDIWDDETNAQVRLSLLEGISLLGGDDDDDRVLFEASASQAGLVERAARALAMRGAPGYEALLARLPAGAVERGYLVKGVVPISGRDSDSARLLAYRACEDATGPALYGVRTMDAHLYLEMRRRANTPRRSHARPVRQRAVAPSGRIHG
jgi:hypothetical protein